MTTTQTRRRRLSGVALALVALVGLGTGSAAQLSVAGNAVGSGVAVVADCQGGAPVRVQLVSGWSTAPQPDAFATTGVVVYDIAPACSGKQLRVALVNAAGTALAEATLASIVGGANPQTGLTLALTPAAGSHLLTSSVAQAKIVITG